MKPKKANDLYKVVAEELNLQETLVEDLIEFMYKNLRKNMSNLAYPRINMDGLGHFIVKDVLVKKNIERINKSLLNHDTYTFNAYHNKKSLESKLEILLKLDTELTQRKEKKEQFKIKKNETKS